MVRRTGSHVAWGPTVGNPAGGYANTVDIATFGKFERNCLVVVKTGTNANLVQVERRGGRET